MHPVEPIVPGPGQESVWDYPRPPRAEPTSSHIVVRFGGGVICETRTAIRILETSHPPTYYLPVDSFAPGVLVPAAGSSFCEWKGHASYFDIVAPNGAVALKAAWGYPDPVAAYSMLRGHVALYAALVDEVTVDGEVVEPQPGGFYGGWVTSSVVGPFKGIHGSMGW